MLANGRMEFPQTLGARISHLRTARGYTQESFGAALNERKKSGLPSITQKALEKLEQGRTPSPRRETLIILSEALDVPEWYWFATHPRTMLPVIIDVRTDVRDMIADMPVEERLKWAWKTQRTLWGERAYGLIAMSDRLSLSTEQLKHILEIGVPVPQPLRALLAEDLGLPQLWIRDGLTSTPDFDTDLLAYRKAFALAVQAGITPDEIEQFALNRLGNKTAGV